VRWYRRRRRTESLEASVDRRERARQRGEVWREVVGIALYLVVAAAIAIGVVWLALALEL
jgi:hypothetical protein